jgi:hypothetical protein
MRRFQPLLPRERHDKKLSMPALAPKVAASREVSALFVLASPFSLPQACQRKSPVSWPNRSAFRAEGKPSNPCLARKAKRPVSASLCWTSDPSERCAIVAQFASLPERLTRAMRASMVGRRHAARSPITLRTTHALSSVALRPGRGSDSTWTQRASIGIDAVRRYGERKTPGSRRGSRHGWRPCIASQDKPLSGYAPRPTCSGQRRRHGVVCRAITFTDCQC